MLLSIPATICVLLLFVHSLYMRPLRATIILFSFIVPCSMLYGGAGFYIFNVESPTIPFLFFIDQYPVPVMNMVGFIFSFYCGISISLHLFERSTERKAPFFLVVVGVVYINAAIGLAIEYVNLSAKWWIWTTDVTDPFDFGSIQAVLRLFGVWGWRPLLIYPILLQFFIRYSTAKAKRRSAWYCLFWFIFFFAWMVYVDIFPVLRPFTILLWIILPWLAKRFPYPEIDMRLVQFNRPMPLWPRAKRWLAA